MTVSAAVVRTLFETDLSEEALELLIADAYASIEARFGTIGERTDIMYPRGPSLFLERPAQAITAVVEVVADGQSLTLADDDWELVHGQVLYRKLQGTNPAYGWPWRVEVTYTPREDNRRDRVVVDLVKLAAQYNALSSETVGDYEAQLPDYQAERDRIVAELGRGLVRFS